MTYQSRWEELPLDVLYQQILSLEDPSQIFEFCYDPYINSKICQDKNGVIWKLLFQRDLSEFPVLKVKENLMDRYIEAIQKIKKLNTAQLSYFAAENGYEKLIQEIHPSDLSLSELDTALLGAANKGHIKIVKYLIENGADIHSSGEGALLLATEKGYLEVVKYLIEHGSDIHANDNEALRLAAESGHLDIVKYLINILTLEKNSTLGQISPKEEENVDFINDALRLAAYNARLKVVIYLLENGANIKIALDIAKQTKNKRLGNMLTKMLQKSTPKKEEILKQTNIQCLGTTKSGQRCCRKTKDGQSFCWSHNE